MGALVLYYPVTQTKAGIAFGFFDQKTWSARQQGKARYSQTVGSRRPIFQSTHFDHFTAAAQNSPRVLTQPMNGKFCSHNCAKLQFLWTPLDLYRSFALNAAFCYILIAWMQWKVDVPQSLRPPYIVNERETGNQCAENWSLMEPTKTSVRRKS